MSSVNIDFSNREVFVAHADAWWDSTGPFGVLHALVPLRLRLIRQCCAAAFGSDQLRGLRVLDIGCGGGLVAEALARLGAHVVAIDVVAETLRTARQHAHTHALTIDYRQTTVEALMQEDPAAVFDIVLHFEVIEHVPSPASFLQASIGLMRQGGVQILSTPNKTWASYGALILAGERLLGFLARGTHDWQRFLSPEAVLTQIGSHASFTLLARHGIVFDPFLRVFRLSSWEQINYVLAFRKDAA